MYVNADVCVNVCVCLCVWLFSLAFALRGSLGKGGAGLAPLGPLAEVCMLVFLCASACVCVCVCMSMRFVSFRVYVCVSVFLSFFVSACVCICPCFWDDFGIIFY